MEKRKGWQKKSAALLCIIIAAVIYSLNSLVLLPIGRILTSNVIYANSVLPMAIGYIAELLEGVAVALFYGLALIAIYRGKKSGVVFIAFASLTAYKYLADMAMEWVESGKVSELWIWEIIDVIYFTALEALLLLIVFALSRKIMSGYTDQKLLAERVFEKTGEAIEYFRVYPFEKLYDKSNCLLRAVMVCALATVVAKLLGDVVSDVAYIVSYGFPKQGITWVYMILNYASKLIFGIVSYLTIYLFLNKTLKE